MSIQLLPDTARVFVPPGILVPMGIISITERSIMNEKNDLLNLSRRDRDRIHELCIKSRQTGLSPPEMEELLRLEGKEALNRMTDYSEEHERLLHFHKPP